MIEYREVQYLGDVSMDEISNDDKSCDGLTHPPIEYAQLLEEVLQKPRNEQQIMHKELQSKQDTLMEVLQQIRKEQKMMHKESQSLKFELIYDYYRPPEIDKIRRGFNEWSE